MIFNMPSIQKSLVAALVLLTRTTTAVVIPKFLDSHPKRDSDVGVVLSSGDIIIPILVPADSLPHQISDLVSYPTLSTDAINGLNYDSIRLLDDERCLS